MVLKALILTGFYVLAAISIPNWVKKPISRGKHILYICLSALILPAVAVTEIFILPGYLSQITDVGIVAVSTPLLALLWTLQNARRILQRAWNPYLALPTALPVLNPVLRHLEPSTITLATIDIFVLIMWASTLILMLYKNPPTQENISQGKDHETPHL